GVGQVPTQVVLADINGDDKLDLLVSHNRTSFASGDRRGVTVRLGNGDFTFGDSSEYATKVRASALAVGDFNKDGFMDFVVADDNAPGAIDWFAGDGTGKFDSGTSFDTGVPNPDAIAVSDFNADGYLDVVVASKSTNNSNTGVAVLLNNFGTGFGTPI